MAFGFVSEALIPTGDFDPAGMASGEPGVPRTFRWRKREYRVRGVVESWREFGNCTHGSGERYVRRHRYRVATEEGLIFQISFQRTSGKSAAPRRRWWIHGVEEMAK